MPCMRQRTTRILYLLLLCSLSARLISAQTSGNRPSFEAFRLRSGMTPDEVTKQFPDYELRWLAQPRGAAILVQRRVNPDNANIYASVSFCKDRVWGLTREVDPDTELLTYLQDYMREY